jgi:hypothetical protein
MIPSIGGNEEQARALAKQMSDPTSKEMMLGIVRITSGWKNGLSGVRKRSER